MQESAASRGRADEGVAGARKAALDEPVMLAQPGDQLEVGDPVVRWSPRAVTASERSPLVVVLAMGAPAGHLSSFPADGAALAAGDILFTWESAPGG